MLLLFSVVILPLFYFPEIKKLKQFEQVLQFLIIFARTYDRRENGGTLGPLKNFLIQKNYFLAAKESFCVFFCK